MDPILTDNIIKLGMAVLVGGLIGAEREYQDKAAGFRTIILITLGSALFTIFSLSIDPGFTQTRIAANIVTGIETIQQALEACSLNAIESHQRKTESAITSTLLVVGSPKNQKKFVEMLMKDKSVKEFDY